MNSIRQTEALNKRELEDCTPVEASWHRDYDDTAFIYIGGLDERLTEGDVITIFSQYGEPVYLNLVRDKETGKSRGFAFLKYEDQRSCDLAVDNLGGAKVMERYLKVDHTRYKKREDEDLSDNTRTFGPQPTEGHKSPRKENGSDYGTEKESEESEAERPLLKEEIELQKLLKMDDEDPMKSTLIEQKREEVEAARRKAKSKRRHKGDRKHRHSHHSSRRKSKSNTHERRNRTSPQRSRSPGRRRNS
jgi:RNA-binding motif X-linked protein 2